MSDVFFQILPFFALIGLGYAAVATRTFGPEAALYLTRFTFFFALSAMLFRFAATLPIETLFDARFGMAYLAGCSVVYLFVALVSRLRRTPMAEAAVEAQCAIIGNVGFLGIPMLVALLGERAAGPVLFVLSIDLIVFGSLLVILINASREGTISPAALGRILMGLLRNPMVMSIVLGLAWSALELPVQGAFDRFLMVLGSAATPCALFAIGASLAGQRVDRPATALWLSFAKLVLHPAAVAVFAFLVFEVEPFAAAVMVAAAAMPTAGNIYIVAQHYGVAPLRASSTIFVSTVGAIFTLTAVLGWVVARWG